MPRDRSPGTVEVDENDLPAIYAAEAGDVMAVMAERLFA